MNRNSTTTFLDAAAQGDDVTIRALLGTVSIDISGNNGSTALIYASNNGRLSTVKLLLENGANVNAKTTSNYTALISASRKGYVDTVAVLLEKGADINAKTSSFSNSNTALLYATQNGHFYTIKQLLKNEADINAKNLSGNTSLHLLATLMRRTDPDTQTVILARIAVFMKLLSLCNVDRTITNNGGRTAEDIAPEIARIAEQVDTYRHNLATQYHFFKTSTVDGQSICNIDNAMIRDWILLTQQEQDVNKLLGDRNAYAPPLKQGVSYPADSLSRLPQEVMDRIRFFLFPLSISQHSFTSTVKLPHTTPKDRHTHHQRNKGPSLFSH